MVFVMGGYLSKTQKIIKADKFNAGQKVWFWLATIGGIVMAVTGYTIYFLLVQQIYCEFLQ